MSSFSCTYLYARDKQEIIFFLSLSITSFQPSSYFFSYLVLSVSNTSILPHRLISHPQSRLFFPPSYCIGTISQFPSLSFFNHPGFHTGIKLSVAHYFAAMSGVSHSIQLAMLLFPLMPAYNTSHPLHLSL